MKLINPINGKAYFIYVSGMDNGCPIWNIRKSNEKKQKNSGYMSLQWLLTTKGWGQFEANQIVENAIRYFKL